MYVSIYFFFFNDTATTEIYTLSLHDALPIYLGRGLGLDLGLGRKRRSAKLSDQAGPADRAVRGRRSDRCDRPPRSEEHTSELQSRFDLVCRLLLEKKKKQICIIFT